jgi:hypothetical protein
MQLQQSTHLRSVYDDISGVAEQSQQHLAQHCFSQR